MDRNAQPLSPVIIGGVVIGVGLIALIVLQFVIRSQRWPVRTGSAGLVGQLFQVAARQRGAGSFAGQHDHGGIGYRAGAMHLQIGLHHGGISIKSPASAVAQPMGGLIYPKARIEELFRIFETDRVAVVVDAGSVVGIISQIDLIEHMSCGRGDRRR